MYHRLLTRAIDTPLLIAEHKLNIISERVLIPIILGQEVPKTLAEGTRPGRLLETNSSHKTVIIPVMDTLFSKNSAGLSGATTYEDISRQMNSAVTAGASHIGFYIDSPGGETFGLFSLMHDIRSLADKGVKTFAFTDGLMTSAAYGIAAATQKIFATESSLAGSIGSVLMHLDRSSADAQAGLKYTILRSKPEKALGSVHEPMTDELRSRLETYLAKVDSMFNNEILKSRSNLSLEGILQMKGSEFLATEAHQLGLVDAIVPTFETALSNFVQTQTKSPSPSQLSGNLKMNDEELMTQLASTKAELATAKVSAEQAVKAAIAEERARILAIIDNGHKLSLSNELIQRHIEKGYSTEASLDIMTEIREGREAATAIAAGTGLQSTVEQDPSIPTRPDISAAYRKAVGKKAVGA